MMRVVVRAMLRARSLRIRLFSLIMVPLILMTSLLGYWRYQSAQETVQELFDRSLLSAALAISRDVANSSGDSLLPSTRTLIQDATGGKIFYHVTGPGGIYVTGYAYPPAPPRGMHFKKGEPHYFEARYRDRSVRVLKIVEDLVYEDLVGETIVTVWQELSDRNVFARQLAVRTFGLFMILLVTLGLVVWFGVQKGLSPLTDLQNAIAARSPDDLSIIKRPVPIEVKGVVQTLNRLLQQLEKSIKDHQVFISDAAHQLRNPANAVQSMAEAVRDAGSDEERQTRMVDLIKAAHVSARTAEQLLSLDRLRHSRLESARTVFDLTQLAADICTDFAPHLMGMDIEFEFNPYDGRLPVEADSVFVSEAIKNLLDNAQKHGGPDLSRVRVETSRKGAFAALTVANDGKALKPEDEAKAFGRFSQVEPSQGSGIGLAIVASVAETHGGAIRIDPCEAGASLTLSLPIKSPVT
nr:sensor histidine kinase [uncultured Cohaesibacter sp.]